MLAYFVDEENAGDEFSDALVDVTVYYFVDLLAEFVCDFCLLWFHELSHHAHHVLTALRPCVCGVKVM